MKGIHSFKLNLAIATTLGLAVAQSASAANIAPTINTFRLNNSSNNITINEGTQVTASFTGTDQNGDQMRFCLRDLTTNAVQCTGYVTPNASKVGSLSTTLSFNDNGTFTYRARSQDIFGLNSTSQITRTITVNNVAPTLTGFSLSSNTIDEGQSASILFSAFDPGADAIAFLLDGNKVGDDFATSGTRSYTQSLGMFADDGTFVYKGQAKDDDGGLSGIMSQTLTIRNVAPTINFLDTILSGRRLDFSALAIDPGINDILTFDWDFDGDGKYNDFSGSVGSWNFTNNGLYNIGLRVSDGDGGFAYESTQVKVIVPEASSVLGTIAIGVLGVGAALKRKRVASRQ